jgi:hypothetical protein
MREEKAREIVERSEAYGFAPEYSAGFITMKRHADDNPEVFSLMVTDVVKYLPEISAILRKRAAATRGKELVGLRIVSQEHGAGTLVGASEDGTLIISISNEMRQSHEEEIRRSQISITANAEDLLVILDRRSDESDVTDINTAKPGPDNRRMGVFDFLRRSAAGSSDERRS